MKKNLIFTILIMVVFIFSNCESKKINKNTILKSDSIEVVNIFFKNNAFLEVFPDSNIYPQLKIVENKYKINYPSYLVNKKQVVFEKIDSSSEKYMSAPLKIKFFMTINKYEFKDTNTFHGEFMFRMSGYYFVFEEKKVNGIWKINKIEVIQS